MQFTNYTDFRAMVLRMIDGDDVASGSISTDTVDALIALGETRTYLGEEGVPGLRTRDMAAALSLPITASAATLPADCLALERVQIGAQVLDYITEDDALRHLQYGGGGTTRFYTQQGNTLLFYPPATGTVTGRYTQRPADLKTALNATFNRYPEVFLYAALAESAPFIGEDGRIPMWKQLWGGLLKTANATEANVASSGGRLTMRAR